MGLRQQLAADLKGILEDSAAGFGWAIRVTDPNGASADLTGYSNDIGSKIDVDTGTVVAGRRAHVLIHFTSLAAGGLGIPKGIADAGKKPWLVEFADIAGTAHTFKVVESMPDRTLSVVKCLLEAYKF